MGQTQFLFYPGEPIPQEFFDQYSQQGRMISESVLEKFPGAKTIKARDVEKLFASYLESHKMYYKVYESELLKYNQDQNRENTDIVLNAMKESLYQASIDVWKEYLSKNNKSRVRNSCKL